MEIDFHSIVNNNRNINLLYKTLDSHKIPNTNIEFTDINTIETEIEITENFYNITLDIEFTLIDNHKYKPTLVDMRRQFNNSYMVWKNVSLIFRDKSEYLKLKSNLIGAYRD